VPLTLTPVLVHLIHRGPRFSQENIKSSFSQQKLPPSQQPRVNEGAINPNARSGSPHPQLSQGTPSSSFSQTLPPSQQIRANESASCATVDNLGPTVRPTVYRPVSPLFSQRCHPFTILITPIIGG